MRTRLLTLSLLFWAAFCLGVHAGPAKILKVLPQYLDEEGRHALSPSLYERDAYQYFLRKNPSKRGGLRFDVNWKAKGSKSETLVLRLNVFTFQPMFVDEVTFPSYRCTARMNSSYFVLEEALRKRESASFQMSSSLP